MFVTLVAVIVALVLGHVAHAPVAALRQFQWFSHGLQWLGARAPEGAFWRQRHGIWLALLPPVLVLALLQFALWGRLLGLASLVLGVLVLAWATRAPVKPPVAAVPVKASVKTRPSAGAMPCQLIASTTKPATT